MYGHYDGIVADVPHYVAKLIHALNSGDAAVQDV